MNCWGFDCGKETAGNPPLEIIMPLIKLPEAEANCMDGWFVAKSPPGFCWIGFGFCGANAEDWFWAPNANLLLKKSTSSSAWLFPVFPEFKKPEKAELAWGGCWAKAPKLPEEPGFELAAPKIL